jgi:hypothetical protein
MEDYHLEYLNTDNAEKWEEFNNNSPEGSFFHSLKWKQLYEKTSGFRTHYFLLFKNGRVFGIFPFLERISYSIKGLIPIPEDGFHYAILQDYSDPAAISHAIQEFQLIHGKKKKFSYVYLSSLNKKIFDTVKNYPTPLSADNGNMILNLQEFPPEKIWENFSAKKGQRKFIRRFEETGYRLTEIHSHDGLKPVYKYYEENIQFIGGSLRPFSHFTDLWNTLSSDEMRTTLLSKESTIAGGLLMFIHKPQKTVYLQYLSLNRNLPTTYHPSYYLFWEAINWAWDNNYEKISFGSQHLDEKNPRYRIKNEFGGNFEPIYSKMIPLTKSFSLGYTCKRYLDRIHLSRQDVPV